MIHGSLLAVDTGAKVFHQLSRAQAMTMWWHWLLLILVCSAITVFVVLLYLRDTVELPGGKALMLLALRLAAFAGVLFFFLDLEKRSERQVVKNSRAVILIDTSLSMGIQDADSAGDRRRIDMVIDEIAQGDLIAQLRLRHDVVVYRFDQDELPAEIASFPRIETVDGPPGTATSAATLLETSANQARTTALAAAIVCGISLLALLVYAITGAVGVEGSSSWLAPVGVVGLIAAVVILGVAHLRFPDVDLATTLWLKPPTAPSETDTRRRPSSPTDDQMTIADVDWGEQLAPRGAETRLGDALRYLVNRERNGSIAGIVTITDGGNNSGIDHQQSVITASNAGIPIFTVGLGSDRRPKNIRVADLEAPQRVYPGDSFSITAYIQAFGLTGRTVKVELVSAAAENNSENTAETFEEERGLKLGGDGELALVRFEVSPTVVGTQRYIVRVKPPNEDHVSKDDQRSAKVQIMDRKNRVLLFAGGPTREFRFLRNLLYRDQDTTVDVLLQTAKPGVSQEGDEVLYEFPELPEELFEYDCIVAFDPNWMALNVAQTEMLKRWVAEKAGGLIVVAGPVHTPRWASRLRGDERIDILKLLYPVVFYSRGSATLSLGRFASESAWPLRFTRDGRDAEYLWLEDDQILSEQAWSRFEGVYGYYAVKDPKAGARVLANFSDPNTAIDGDLPIYMASHFFGAGRVFFQASGEMWRIRAVNDEYFERYYTKLIRWASQGRLLRDSSRGILLVDKDRCSLGDHVSVQAILTDAQFEPLGLPSVNATLRHPDGRRTPLFLRRVENAARDGLYSAQFVAKLEGDYVVELQPPHGGDRELLSREVRSRIPALETEQPERNDPLLKYLAEQTGGAYYVGIAAAMNRGGTGAPPLANLVEPQDQVTFLAGSPDRDFERQLMGWLMGIICGVLCLEWLIRRLSKLA
ncbi:MAG TPA: VWA domain-containing protein [Pirellulaceae bacterium]|nr:VWA domain-containing protein [Pirellulaceae bacterium]